MNCSGPVFFETHCTLVTPSYAMHSTCYAVARCPSVFLSVTRRHSVEMAKHIKRFHHEVAMHRIFIVFQYQTLWQYSDGEPLNGASNAGVCEKDRDFWPIFHFISEMIQDRAMVTMEYEYRKQYPSFRTVPFSMTLNDSQSRCQGRVIYLALIISETVRDTMEY